MLKLCFPLDSEKESAGFFTDVIRVEYAIRYCRKSFDCRMSVMRLIEYIMGLQSLVLYGILQYKLAR